MRWPLFANFVTPARTLHRNNVGLMMADDDINMTYTRGFECLLDVMGQASKEYNGPGGLCVNVCFII